MRRASMAPESTPRTGHTAPSSAKFADEAEVGGTIEADVLGAGDHGEGNREIKGRAFLFHIGGSEAHGDVAAGPVEAAVGDRGLHTVEGLADGGIRQADDDDGILLPAIVADLDLQIIRLKSEDGGRENFCEYHGQMTEPGSA